MTTCICGRMATKVIKGISLCDIHGHTDIPRYIQDNWDETYNMMQSRAEPDAHTSRHDGECAACGQIIRKGDPVKTVPGIMIHITAIWCWYRS